MILNNERKKESVFFWSMDSHVYYVAEFEDLSDFFFSLHTINTWWFANSRRSKRSKKNNNNNTEANERGMLIEIREKKVWERERER